MTLNLDDLEATARAVCVPEAWAIWHDLDHQGFKTVGDAESYAEMREAGEVDECDPIAHVYTDDLAEHIATFDPPTVLALIAKLREAEAVIAEVRGVLHAASIPPGVSEALFNKALIVRADMALAGVFDEIVGTP